MGSRQQRSSASRTCQEHHLAGRRSASSLFFFHQNKSFQRVFFFFMLLKSRPFAMWKLSVFICNVNAFFRVFFLSQDAVYMYICKSQCEARSFSLYVYICFLKNQGQLIADLDVPRLSSSTTFFSGKHVYLINDNTRHVSKGAKKKKKK